MKIITKPQQKEEVEIYSDFSGERFHHDIPEVTIKFSFEYGSKYDDSQIEFHLNDNEAKDILELIKAGLSDKTKENIKKCLEKANKEYDECMDFRDWNGCDYHGASIELYKYFLNYGEESAQG